MPLEWHAASVYTRVMFDKFSTELYSSGPFCCSRLGRSSSYMVQGTGSDDAKVYKRRISDGFILVTMDCLLI